MSKCVVLSYCPECKEYFIPAVIEPKHQKYINDYGDEVDTIVNIDECEACEIKKR